jgi:hypothetical protein
LVLEAAPGIEPGYRDSTYNVGVIGYRVYRNGTFVGSTTS